MYIFTLINVYTFQKDHPAMFVRFSLLRSGQRQGLQRVTTNAIHLGCSSQKQNNMFKLGWLLVISIHLMHILYSWNIVQFVLKNSHATHLIDQYRIVSLNSYQPNVRPMNCQLLLNNWFFSTSKNCNIVFIFFPHYMIKWETKYLV